LASTQRLLRVLPRPDGKIPPITQQLWLTDFRGARGNDSGIMFAGIPGDKFGRRGRWGNGGAICDLGLGCALCWKWRARFCPFHWRQAIGGPQAGADVHRRGCARRNGAAAWYGWFQFNNRLRNLCSRLCRTCCGTIHFGAVEWRWKTGIPAIPADSSGFRFGLPRSPAGCKETKDSGSKRRACVTGEEKFEQELQGDYRLDDADHMADGFACSPGSIGYPFYGSFHWYVQQLSGINAIVLPQ